MAWVFLPVAVLAAEPVSVEAPTYRVGDTWTVDIATQIGTNGFSRQRLVNTVDRVSSDELLVGVKADGSPRAPEEHRIGLDLSLKLLVNGEQIVTARPFVFPLKVGQTWTSDWIDPRQQGRQIWAHFRKTAKVIGWEDVTVPAGTFHALKIESTGSADMQISVPAQASSAASAGGGAATVVSHTQTAQRGTMHGTLFDTIYYAPNVKYYVKLVEEQYNASDVLIKRDTTELAAYSVDK